MMMLVLNVFVSVPRARDPFCSNCSSPLDPENSEFMVLTHMLCYE